MKPYELVVVLKASLPADEKKVLLTSIQEVLGEGTIQATDDMGVIAAAYPLQRKKENAHIHVVSYYIHANPQAIADYTKKFAYLKGLIRNFFYAMGANEAFVTYAEMQKKLEQELAPKTEKPVK